MSTLLEFATSLAHLAVDGFLLAFTIVAFGLGLTVGVVAVAGTIGALRIAFDLVRLAGRLVYGMGLRLAGKPDPRAPKKPGASTDAPGGVHEMSDAAIERIQERQEQHSPKPAGVVKPEPPPAPPKSTITPIKTEMVATSPDGRQMTLKTTGTAAVDNIVEHLARAGFKEVDMGDGVTATVRPVPPAGIMIDEETGALLDVETGVPIGEEVPPTIPLATSDLEGTAFTVSEQALEDAHARVVRDLGIPPLRPGVPINIPPPEESPVHPCPETRFKSILPPCTFEPETFEPNPNPTGTEAWEREELRKLAAMQDERKRRPLDPCVSMVDGPVPEQVDARDCATTDGRSLDACADRRFVIQPDPLVGLTEDASTLQTDLTPGPNAEQAEDIRP